MQQTCPQCQAQFDVTEEDLQFYDKISPTFDDTKCPVPPPTLCPDCRSLRRMYFRNFRSLYTRQSDKSGQKIISMYHPDSPFTVYTPEEWWSDDWDPLSYGQSVDLSRSIFEQLEELFRVVPRMSLMSNQSENCGFCNFAFQSKGCYLVFGCVANEDCLYGHIVWQSTNCLEGLYLYRCERCYDCIDCVSCYHSLFSAECTNCSDVQFCYNCRGCDNCFGCVGLRQQKWCWFNESVGRDQYLANLQELLPLTQDKIREQKDKLAQLKLTLPTPAFYGSNNDNVSGDHIYFSKNAHHCFDIKECEDCKFIYTGQNYTDSYDVSFSPGKGEKVYNCLACTGSFFSLIGCHVVTDSANVLYSESCFSCNDCFGCFGLRHQRHCIFNKQYTPEEYNQLVPQIINHMNELGEWGEFFPFSCFGYNESIAFDYHPLTREEAAAQGFTWSDFEAPVPQAAKTIPATEVPATIDQVTDDILEQAIICEVTSKPFKITAQELKFYRDHGLPLPRRHPDQRYRDQMTMRNERTLHPRQCAKCGKEVTSTFAPDRPEIIYCEECYLAESY